MKKKSDYKMKRLAKSKVGAKKKKIDFVLLDELISIFCTQEECAGVLCIDADTLNARIREKHGIHFSDYYKQKNHKGKASLRRRQHAMIEKNPVMAIFLGKQYLGQSDKSEVKQDVNMKVDEKREHEIITRIQNMKNKRFSLN